MKKSKEITNDGHLPSRKLTLRYYSIADKYGYTEAWEDGKRIAIFITPLKIMEDKNGFKSLIQELVNEGKL